MNVKVGEMFAGIGGFRLGLEKAQASTRENTSPTPSNDHSERRSLERDTFSVVWANENNKYAAQIYRKNFGEKELQECDIQKVKADSLPQLDLLCGGFPCQSFSTAGNRKGFSDTRGTLFFEIARIAEAKRPKFLLLENVKGLLSAQEGYCFWRIKETLEELGYIVEWKVLNSKYYGVPQNRERVFIIGHLREECSRTVFPIQESCEYNDEMGETAEGRGQGIRPSNISPALRGGEKWACLISPTLSAGYYKRQHGQISVLLDNLGGNIKQRVQENGTAWTLGGSKTGIIEKSRIRRLTPTECERLQGFPDNWTKGVSDTQRYKCLGNAVTVNVIEYIGRLLLRCFSQKQSERTK